MTIILTKPVRVGGVELAAATTQTFAADVEAHLISRGAATPVFLAPGQVAPGANHISEHRQLGGVANQIAAIGTPFVILPGDGAAVGMFFTGTAGAFTLSAAILANIWNALKGCWVYMPASFGGSAYPAGWYWAVFSSDTAGILYTDTYTSGTPKRPASPTAFPSNLTGWLTTTTSEITGPTGFVLPGGSMGPNGSLKIHFRASGNTGVHKTRSYVGSANIITCAVSTSPNVEFLTSVRNQGSETMQYVSSPSSKVGVGVAAAISDAAESISVNTGADNNLSFSLQNSSDTACSILLHADITCTYGA